MKFSQSTSLSGVSVALICLLAIVCGPAEGQNTLVTNGVLNMAPNDTTCRDYTIPNSTENPYLYLGVTGADGGARHYKVLSTCSHGGGQGARVGGWYKIGNDGLKPGGTLRFIFGKKGTTTYQIGDAFSNVVAGGGGGGTAVLYRPPGGTTWEILLVGGGGGGAASDGFCGGKTGEPGQAGTSGSNGTGIGYGNGGSNGEGGDHGEEGNGGGGWYHPGKGKCPKSSFQSTEEDLDGNTQYINYGGGFSGSGKAGPYASHWVGGEGGLGNMNYPDDGNNCKGYNFTGGYGFGGGGAGHGSGGGGGGYSGGGGGGLVGVGFGAGGGGGSFVNSSFTIPFATILKEQRGTTTSPADGTIEYQFTASSPATSRDLGFHYNKSTEASVLKTGEWNLRWQSDGNLVLYQAGGGAKWASNTNTKGTDIYFQSDGNLVIRQNGNAIWASNTANDQHGGKGGRKLVLTNEGSLFITDQDGKVIWRGR